MSLHTTLATPNTTHAAFTASETAVLRAAGRTICPRCEMECNTIETLDNPAGWCTACVEDCTRQAREYYERQQ